MKSFHQYRLGLPYSSFTRVAFAIAITVFVMVFEWADLKGGREAKAYEKHDF